MSGTSSQSVTIKYAIMTLVAAALVVGGLKWLHRNQDAVSFGRSTFTGLVRGRTGMHSRIDWDHLKALEVDIGATYAKIATDKDKASYRKSFIQGFAYGFAQSHARPESFVNWRIQERTPEQVVIAADFQGKGKTLLLLIPAAGKRKIQAIRWAS